MTKLAELRRLREAGTAGEWEWDAAAPGEPPHIHQGAHLGDTLIALDNTYEGSDIDCALVAAAVNSLLPLVEVAEAAEEVNRLGYGPPSIATVAEFEAATARLRTALAKLTKETT